MPVFVHLASERNLALIRRRGIAAGRAGGVFAMPVTRNFQVSHQWLRELKRHGGGTIVGVYFRLPDDEPVEVGHFGGAHVRTTAADAVRLMLGAERNDPAAARAHDAEAEAKWTKRQKRGRNRHEIPPPQRTSPEGYEVVVPRGIDTGEILRFKALPQVVGWRYRPGAHGKPPCACLCCEKGTWGIRRLERRVEEDERRGRRSKVTLFGRGG